MKVYVAVEFGDRAECLHSFLNAMRFHSESVLVDFTARVV